MILDSLAASRNCSRPSGFKSSLNCVHLIDPPCGNSTTRSKAGRTLAYCTGQCKPYFRPYSARQGRAAARPGRLPVVPPTRPAVAAAAKGEAGISGCGQTRPIRQTCAAAVGPFLRQDLKPAPQARPRCRTLLRGLELDLLEIKTRRALGKVEHLHSCHLILSVEIQHNTWRHLLGLHDGRVVQAEIKRIGFTINRQFHNSSPGNGGTSGEAARYFSKSSRRPAAASRRR